jgi:hypothetical protein
MLVLANGVEVSGRVATEALDQLEARIDPIS